MAFSDLMADLYGASIGEFIVERRRKAKRTEAEIAQYGMGTPVRLRASTYGFSTYLRSAWVGGVFDVVPGLLIWHNGYVREKCGFPVTPANFTPSHLRAVNDREMWSVTNEHVILVGELDKRRVEIAAFIEEMPVLLDALGAKGLVD